MRPDDREFFQAIAADLFPLPGEKKDHQQKNSRNGPFVGMKMGGFRSQKLLAEPFPSDIAKRDQVVFDNTLLCRDKLPFSFQLVDLVLIKLCPLLERPDALKQSLRFKRLLICQTFQEKQWSPQHDNYGFLPKVRSYYEAS